MKRTVHIVFAAVLALAALALAPAAQEKPQDKAAKALKKNPVVVSVDMARIFKESKLSKLLQAEFKVWDDGLKAQVTPKMEAMRQKQQALQEGEAKMTAEQKDAAQKEIQALQQELSQIQMRARQEFQAKQTSAGEKMQAKLGPVVEALGKEQGWDVVVSKGEQALWTSDAIDQTDLILARLDKDTPDAPQPTTPVILTPAAPPSTPPPAPAPGK